MLCGEGEKTEAIKLFHISAEQVNQHAFSVSADYTGAEVINYMHSDKILAPSISIPVE